MYVCALERARVHIGHDPSRSPNTATLSSKASHRFDKRAAPIGEPDRPSLKAFQQEVEQRHKVEEQARLAAAAVHHAPTAGDLPSKVGDLTLDRAPENDDGRTLADRLTTPSEASNSATAALLARSLQLRHGELILQLGPHNLHHKTLISIFDSPDDKSTTPAPDDEIVLPTTTVNTILATLKSIAGEIKSEVSILHNPFDDEGKRKIGEGPLATETASSANDETVKARWKGKTLRLLVRRIGEGAEDLNEVRVAVVGNVDAGKSSLLGGETIFG